MNTKTNVLVLNVTDRGVVAQVESPTSEGSQLCFISHERASMLNIEVPTKKETWSSKTSAIRNRKGAFAKYSKASTQTVDGMLTPYPLSIKGEPWMIKGSEEQWHGLKLVL
jgi:hypothetical protein